MMTTTQVCQSLEDTDKVLLYCHAGCTYEAIAKELGVNHTAPAGKPESYQGNPIVAWYQYRDEQGRILYEIARIQKGSDKDFRPYCHGQFKLNGQQKVLYRLPELIKAPVGDWVFLCEGEKDADNVARLGLVATTNTFGGMSWECSYTPYFKGRRVCILNDNDDTGRERGSKLLKELKSTAKEVRTLDLPNLPQKGDVSDWIASGGTKEQLVAWLNITSP
jgi:5S rRNA maturation endonuclease (ribonuclease M5)